MQSPSEYVFCFATFMLNRPSYPMKDALQFAASENLATSGSFPQILFPARLGCRKKYSFRSLKYLSIAAFASSTDL